MATLTVGGAGLEPTAVRTLSPHPIPLDHPTPRLSEDYQITAVRDPNFGETVFKDGARTGLTEGLVQGEDIYAFWKNSISPAPRRSEAPPQDRPTIVEGRLRVMWPIGGNAQPVDSGDSGSPVLGMAM